MDKKDRIETQVTVNQKSEVNAASIRLLHIKVRLKKLSSCLRKMMGQLKSTLLQVSKKCQTFYLSRSRQCHLIMISIASVIFLLFLGVKFLFVTDHVGAFTQLQPSKPSQVTNHSPNVDWVADRMTSTDTQVQTMRTLLQKLDAMQAALSKTSLSSQKLSTLKSQMQVLAQSVSQLKTSSDALRTAALKSEALSSANQQKATQQAVEVQAQLSKISKSVMPQQYLPISDLPFHVVGIDFWNGKPMVSVVMKDVIGVTHYRLMGQGMTFNCHSHSQVTCKSWTLHRIQTGPNRAIFMNQKGQKIKVEF